MKQLIWMITGLALLAGCSEQESPERTGMNIDGGEYLLNEEPEGAGAVIMLRESAKDGDEILIVGRIGGKSNPWIKGMAAFTIVDPSLTPCNELPGDDCPEPWDYCCATDVALAMVLVKVVDANGQVVETDARELLDLEELNTVIAKGTAQRDDDGNMTILASHLYVKK
ncbi:MAG: hypothetical protein VB878_09535 [Pirellulaceae bacterium]